MVPPVPGESPLGTSVGCKGVGVQLLAHGPLAHPPRRGAWGVGRREAQLWISVSHF